MLNDKIRHPPLEISLPINTGLGPRLGKVNSSSPALADGIMLTRATDRKMGG